MNILAYDLYPDHNFAREEQIVYTSLDELYLIRISSLCIARSPKRPSI